MQRHGSTATSPDGDVLHSDGGSSTVRRFRGRVADELAVRVRAGRAAGDVARAFESAYREVTRVLRGFGGSLDNVECETLYLRHAPRDLPVITEVRRRVVHDALGQAAGAPPLACIGQAPLGPPADFELLVTALIPHTPSRYEVRDLALPMACACTGCRIAGGRLIRVGTQTVLHSGTLYGTGDPSAAQLRTMFETAERLLAAGGLGVRDIVRTWLYLRDIDRDYAVLNTERRAFFGRHGIALRPASTGVQGIPAGERHACAMRFLAIRAEGGLERSAISAPCLNEAWSYGADFSRGLAVRDANKTALYISGTASIDARGRTAHAGDFAAQARRMLANVEALLARCSAGFGDVLSAVVYLKDPADEARLRTALARHGVDGFPVVTVATPLCRPDLLCETEVTAALP